MGYISTDVKTWKIEGDLVILYDAFGESLCSLNIDQLVQNWLNEKRKNENHNKNT